MPSTPAKQRERRRALKARGVCTRCQTRKAREGLVTCQACIEDIRARKARYRATPGRCAPCGRKTDGAAYACAKCRAWNAACMRRVRKVRRERGECHDCGRAMPEKGWCRCPVCGARTNELAVVRKAVYLWRN